MNFKTQLELKTWGEEWIINIRGRKVHPLGEK